MGLDKIAGGDLRKLLNGAEGNMWLESEKRSLATR